MPLRGGLVCPAGARPLSFFHCVRLFFAPRGGFHHHPPVRGGACADSLAGSRFSRRSNFHPNVGRGQSAGAAGWLFMALRAGFFFARRVRGQAPVVHCVRLFFAPRAGSGRSGCASSAALRPAFACDRAGTARRADPRCSPPSPETLGRGQRLHPPVWPLGALTLRPYGSSRPRGGFHHHHPGAP